MTLDDRIAAAAPAIEMHTYFEMVREAIRDSCGRKAPALIAQLVHLKTLVELAAMEAACARYVAENTRTAQAANECLVRIGTHLPDGTLAPEYGG